MLVGLVMIKDVVVTKLDIIETLGGDVMHAMKESSVGYAGFGEVYFSQVNKGAIKAWKRHKKMTLNLVVPVGEIRFVLFDDREGSNSGFQEFILSIVNYSRLTVPPRIWVGFQGLSVSDSMLLNIADIQHSRLEVDVLDLDDINYDWSETK